MGPYNCTIAYDVVNYCSINVLFVTLFFIYFFYYITYSHVEFERDGKQCMRIQFYVSGPHKNGTAHLEVAKVSLLSKILNHVF